MEQSTFPALCHQTRQFQLAARERVSQAVFDSSARFETTVSLELRQAQFNKESTMQHTERYVLFRLGIPTFRFPLIYRIGKNPSRWSLDGVLAMWRFFFFFVNLHGRRKCRLNGRRKKAIFSIHF